ncbi:Fic family protein [Streptomyces sp. SID13726]|uniref:Fic family protein n=1 Tax=Streptomyces sp. SID13726 TaxID=2706058 RepID=UPI0013B65177|nr:Fic family protein [Streptomyces sp. SID13726]NEB06332.1 Fic family protein [Streptomyces sp. SID13726]
MTVHSSEPVARRVTPVVPPLDAEVVPGAAGARALAALATLTEATRRHLDNPDLFHRPRFRTKMHERHLADVEHGQVTARIAEAAENRAAAGLLAVHSVRAERAERPDRRPCFTPDALAELHKMLVAADPNIPGTGGFRRSTSRVSWPDGRRFVMAVGAGEELREHVQRWYEWGTRTTSAPLDAAALSMVRLLTIHPFPDANGRTSRLLAECDLVAAGLMPGLLLDIEGWIEHHRVEHDEAVVAAAEGRWEVWGELFARTVAETAHHRIATVTAYGTLIDEAIERSEGDAATTAVLTCLRSSPAVSADWLRNRIPHDPAPPLAHLLAAGVLVPHPRLPGAMVHPESLAILDTPYGASGVR